MARAGTTDRGTAGRAKIILQSAIGASPKTILRIWRKGCLQPHRTETFAFNRDPELVAG